MYPEYVRVCVSLSIIHTDKLKKTKQKRHVKYTNETGYAKRPHFTYELYVRGKFHERLERTKTLSLWHAGEGENAVEIQFDTETMLVYVNVSPFIFQINNNSTHTYKTDTQIDNSSTRLRILQR